MDIKSLIIIDNNDDNKPKVKHQVRYSTNLQFENKEKIPLEYRVVIKNRLGEIDWEGKCFNGYLEAWLTVASEEQGTPTILLSPHVMEIYANEIPIVIPVYLNITLNDILMFMSEPVVTETTVINNTISNDTQYNTLLLAVNNMSALVRKLVFAFGKDIRESPTTIEQPNGQTLSL